MSEMGIFRQLTGKPLTNHSSGTICFMDAIVLLTHDPVVQTVFAMAGLAFGWQWGEAPTGHLLHAATSTTWV